jgi:histidinol-phosphate phosphatase family protein
MTQSEPALFLDRDGTLIEDVGFLSDPGQIAFLPGAIAALQILSRQFKLFIVTNQSGISLGKLTSVQVDIVNRHVVDTLAGHGIPIEAVYVCPHTRAEDCQCIKPRPWFLHKASIEHHIDLHRSFTIGDHPHDALFGPAAGAQGVYVLSGHGRSHRADLPSGIAVIESLADFPRFAAECDGCVPR